MSSRKRLRVKKACSECRRRKRGCDQNQPCGPCSQSGFECIYDNNSPARPIRSTDPGRPFAETSQLISPSEARFAGINGPGGRFSNDISIQLADTQNGAGVLSEYTPRFVKRTSAIAFPRLLGIALKAEKLPKLHSYAYNLGSRPEEISIDFGVLAVSANDVRVFSEAFFRLPIDVVDKHWFDQKVVEYYNNPHPHLGTILGGVFALGSCLSDGHPLEQDVVRWCKSCLEDSSVARRPSIEIVIGFTLRVWYLRMTTRPNCAWLASCTMIHLMEAVGLHREENIARLTEFASLSERSLRLLFWNSLALHKGTSLEYGRTNIELVITTQRTNSKFLDLISATSLEGLDGIQVIDDFLIFTKADTALYLFRCMWESKLNVNTTLLFQIGTDALNSAERLCRDYSKTLYFNTLGSTFQFACALMALNTSESLKILSRAVEVLDMIAKRINTSMARDALATANSLLGAVIQARKGELDELDSIYMHGVQTPASTFTDTAFDFDWALFDEGYPAIDGV